MKRLSLAIITLLACAGAQAASEEKVTMNLVTSQGVGQAIGTVTIAETGKGLEFTPDLKALPRVNMASMSMRMAVANRRLKKEKPQPRNRLEAIMIRTKPASTKVRKAQATWATCRCWW